MGPELEVIRDTTQPPREGCAPCEFGEQKRLSEGNCWPEVQADSPFLAGPKLTDRFFCFCFLLKNYLMIFREREEGGRGKETSPYCSTC